MVQNNYLKNIIDLITDILNDNQCDEIRDKLFKRGIIINFF